ncbi:MAG TPA: hypothetical protein VIM73_14555, partial [Polyangiaceae bacterium]
MRKFRILWLVATLSACGGGDQQSPTSSDLGPSPADANGSGTLAAAAGNLVPARDEAHDFAARLAAVSEIVGEEAARRVVVSADTQAKPIHRLELANGNSIEWYEVLAGIPVAVESGYSTSSVGPELKLKKMSAGELYAALAPGVTVPSELVELDRREQELAPIYRRLAAAADDYRSVAFGPLESTLGDPVRSSAPLDQAGAQESVAQRRLALTA